MAVGEETNGTGGPLVASHFSPSAIYGSPKVQYKMHYSTVQVYF